MHKCKLCTHTHTHSGWMGGWVVVGGWDFNKELVALHCSAGHQLAIAITSRSVLGRSVGRMNHRSPPPPPSSPLSTTTTATSTTSEIVNTITRENDRTREAQNPPLLLVPLLLLLGGIFFLFFLFFSSFLPPSSASPLVGYRPTDRLTDRRHKTKGKGTATK